MVNVDLEKELFKSILDNPSVFVIGQQKDTPELSYDERLEVISNLYKTKKSIFLVRYNKYLSKDQLEYIRDSSQSDKDEEVRYYLDKLIPDKNDNLVKRRRYTALQSLIQQGDYFNDNNMRERNPNLYEQMVGRYLSTAERSKIEEQDRDISEVQRPLSSFLLRQMEKNWREESRLEQNVQDGDDPSSDGEFLRRIQKYNRQTDGEQEEEEEEEEEEEFGGETMEAEQSLRQADQDHKEYLRKEFTNIMYENFLAGKDVDFNYESVDKNESYDPIDIIDRDAEESWFDSEEPD